MKKHFLKAAALCALMLGAETTFAQVPEHVYLVGAASPTLWYIDEAVEMTKEGDGVFTYHGLLYKQGLQFITERNWDAIRIVPPGDGWHLTQAHTYSDQITGVVGSENKFWVVETATYDIKLTITDGGMTIKCEAAYAGEPRPQVVMMGGISNYWDTATPHMSATLFPVDEENPDVFVWEGVPVPHAECKHLKFINYPSNYWETSFFVPASVNHNGNVQLVEDGGEYEVVERYGVNEGEIDNFWGFTAEQCDGSTYRITLDLLDSTIKVEKTADAPAGLGDGVENSAFKAFFAGGQLVVKGATAPIEVYNMAGRRVAGTEGETLVMSGLPDGVYMVKSGATVQKILK